MTYQITPLPTKAEKERTRKLRKAAKKRKQAEVQAKKRAKLEKLVEARKAYAYTVRARLLAFDAAITALQGALRGEEK